MLRAGCSDTPGAFFVRLCLRVDFFTHGFLGFLIFGLFQEYEIYCKYKEQYCHKVVPLQCLALEKH